jgi:hypothetical protein
MLPSQLSLFDLPTSPSTVPIVTAPRACRCGCTTAILGSSQAMHAGRMLCSACGGFMGWASHALVNEARAGFVTGISSYDPGTRP